MPELLAAVCQSACVYGAPVSMQRSAYSSFSIDSLMSSPAPAARMPLLYSGYMFLHRPGYQPPPEQGLLAVARTAVHPAFSIENPGPTSMYTPPTYPVTTLARPGYGDGSPFSPVTSREEPASTSPTNSPSQQRESVAPIMKGRNFFLLKCVNCSLYSEVCVERSPTYT